MLSLVDRKTQLEREVAEARAQLPALQARAEDAERKVAEGEVQIETLQERDHRPRERAGGHRDRDRRRRSLRPAS